MAFHIVRIYLRTRLADKEFCAIMHGLNLAYHPSMIWQSRLAMLKTAGIEEAKKDLYRWIAEFNINYKRVFYYTADVFNIEGDLVYIMNNADSLNFSHGKIEAGIITENEEKGRRILNGLAKAFNNSARTMIDGRSVRHKKFTWSIFSEEEHVYWHVTGRKKFEYPEMNDEEVNVLEWLTDDFSRSVIRETAEHGARVLWSYRTDDKKGYKELVDQLVDADLMEITNDKFSLTKFGKKLHTKSYWMTIWLTKTLLDLGIPLKSIIWNAQEGSDEVDLVAQYKSKIWIFELKDKNFELDRAHLLPFRARKFKADRLFVITTGKIAKEARHAFGDPTAETIAIEGLGKTNAILNQIMLDTQIDYIIEVQKELSSRMDISLTQIFQRKYGKRTPKRFKSEPFEA